MNSTPDQSAKSNPAVFRCCEAWRQAYHAALASGEPQDSTRNAGRGAYLKAMPALH